MGMPFNGQLRIAYNREIGKWQEEWIDNFSANFTHMNGELKDKTMHSEGSYIQGGVEIMIRETTNLSDTLIQWSMEQSMDGGKTWFEGMKATYKKQK